MVINLITLPGYLLNCFTLVNLLCNTCNMPTTLQLYPKCNAKMQSTGKVLHRHNTGIIGNFKSKTGSFCGNKKSRIRGEVLSIIYHGLTAKSKDILKCIYRGKAKYPIRVMTSFFSFILELLPLMSIHGSYLIGKVSIHHKKTALF